MDDSVAEFIVAPTVLEIMRPLIIRNVQTDPRTQDILFFRRNGLVSFLGLPVTAGGDSLGILCVYTKDEHQFTDEEVAFFNTLAGQAAMPFKAPIYSRRSAPATRLRDLLVDCWEVQETDRRHVARELHDEIGQILTGLKLTFEITPRLPFKRRASGSKKRNRLSTI